MAKDNYINEAPLRELALYFAKKRIIKSEEERRKISQRYVSEQTGISNAEISRIEKEKRNNSSLYVILKLCKFYQVTEEEVIRFYRNVMCKPLSSSEDIVCIMLDVIEERNQVIEKQNETILNLTRMLDDKSRQQN